MPRGITRQPANPKWDLQVPAMGLLDMGASTLRGATVGALGGAGDLLSLISDDQPLWTSEDVSEFLPVATEGGSPYEDIGGLIGLPVPVAAYGKTVQALAPEMARLAEGYVRDIGGIKDIFIGPNAKTWDSDAFEKAKQMDAKGKSWDEIQKQTGVMRNASGSFLQEISDADSALLYEPPSHAQMMEIAGRPISENDFLSEFANTPEANAIRTRNSMMSLPIGVNTPFLKDVISHNALFDAYPDLANIRVHMSNQLPMGMAGYNHALNRLVVSPVGGDEAKKSILHEINHAIQSRDLLPEGGSPGGMGKRMRDEAAYLKNNASNQEDLKRAVQYENLSLLADQNPDIADQLYESLEGEILSRMVEKRMNLSQDELRKNPLFNDYDIPLSRVITTKTN